MGGDDVQVSHHGSDDDMGGGVAALEPIRDLGHERWDLLGVGSLVQGSAVSGGDPDRIRTPAARALVPLELARFEMEIKNYPVGPMEAGVFRHDPYVFHRPGVAGDGELAFIVRAGSFLAGDDRDGFIRWEAEALDRS
jgi:hypothetical protein